MKLVPRNNSSWQLHFLYSQVQCVSPLNCLKQPISPRIRSEYRTLVDFVHNPNVFWSCTLACLQLHPVQILWLGTISCRFCAMFRIPIVVDVLSRTDRSNFHSKIHCGSWIYCSSFSHFRFIFCSSTATSYWLIVPYCWDWKNRKSSPLFVDRGGITTNEQSNNLPVQLFFLPYCILRCYKRIHGVANSSF